GLHNAGIRLELFPARRRSSGALAAANKIVAGAAGGEGGGLAQHTFHSRRRGGLVRWHGGFVHPRGELRHRRANEAAVLSLPCSSHRLQGRDLPLALAEAQCSAWAQRSRGQVLPRAPPPASPPRNSRAPAPRTGV
ncbi:hypothetical protein MC885_005724, partial [Smutsia gigantea]